MTSILVTRNQFNITPQGIIHKPTDAYFAPHPGDPYSGSIRLGKLGNVVPVGDRYDPDQVKKMMMQYWTEFVAANSGLFSKQGTGAASIQGATNDEPAHHT